MTSHQSRFCPFIVPLIKGYCNNYTLCPHNRFKKDPIALQSVIPAMKDLYPNNNFSFIQDSAPSHRAKIIQNFLREELKSRYVANTELPLSSTDCNLLNYYFRNGVKEKGYSCHNAKHFESEKEYKNRIFSVYDKCWTTS